MRNASAYGGAARGRPVAAWLVLALAAAAAAAVPAAAQQCVLQMGTQSMPFNQCTTINDIGGDFRLFWNSSAANAASVTWGMSTAGKSGYVSFAFPESPGDMVGAYAFSLQSCASWPTGAQLRQYYLAGTTSGSIESTTSPPINGAASAATMPGGGLAAAFTTELPEGSSPDGVPLIFAAGAVYSDGYIRQHSTYGSGTLDLSTGALSDAETDKKAISALVATHLWLLIIGWGVLFPVGIVIARCFKELDPLWFKLHRAIQSLGVLLGVVGLALGFVIAGGWGGRFTVHRNLGLAATILGLAQIPAIRWRPALSHPRRRLWNLFHWWTGRAAVLLAVANIFYGLINVLDVSAGAWGAYTAVFSVIVAAGIAKDSFNYLRLPPPGAKTVNGANSNGAATTGSTAATGQEVGLAEL